MTAPDDLVARFNEFRDWLAFRQEQGCNTGPLQRKASDSLSAWISEAETLKPGKPSPNTELDDWDTIRVCRLRGKRRYSLEISDAELEDKLLGAWLGRAAGCILGIPCEGMTKSEIRSVCKALGQRYPLSGYWEQDPKPHLADIRHYGLTPRRNFLAKNLKRIGTDDDLTYTLLGLLILEEFGPDFTSEDVGRAWLKYLPVACTAEHVALENLRRGISPPETADCGNPYAYWIGAAIRSDPWGYAAPGQPEKAAEFAYRDAVISHRGVGIHAEMYFSAAIALAFVVNDPVEVCKAALKEIPKNCRFSQTVQETLRWCRYDENWDTTTNRILDKYADMSGVHSINNAALTVAGLYYGRKDFGDTIGLTVMGGWDTDCTAATAGSILGAILGAKGLPKKWIVPLGVQAESYLMGKRIWKSEDIARRFLRIAKSVRAE